MSHFGELRQEGTGTESCRGHCRAHFLDNLKTMQIIVKYPLRPCRAAGANQTVENEATNGFSKSCEPLIGSESILGFVECGFAGMGS